MKSIALISVYLGPLPGWLPIWLNSCATNNDIEFYLITDHPQDVPYAPSNVNVVTMGIGEIRERFSRAAGFSIELPKPYKICDFKPLYGSAFQDLIRRFDFWGHTDIDMFFGRLRHFLTEDRLERHIRLYVTGHLSLFRNDDIGNLLYRRPNKRLDWRTVFTNPQSYHFDERHGIYQTVVESGLPYYVDNASVADIAVSSPYIRLANSGQNAKQQTFVFDNGRVLQLFMEDREVREREFIYLHFQKRSIPKLPAESWRDVRQWIFTAHGAVSSFPTCWNARSISAANKPNVLHLYQFCLRKLRSDVSFIKHPEYPE